MNKRGSFYCMTHGEVCEGQIWGTTPDQRALQQLESCGDHEERHSSRNSSGGCRLLKELLPGACDWPVLKCIGLTWEICGFFKVVEAHLASHGSDLARFLSSIHSLLRCFHASLLPPFLPSLLPPCLPSLLPFFLACFLPSFFTCLLPAFRTYQGSQKFKNL